MKTDFEHNLRKMGKIHARDLVHYFENDFLPSFGVRAYRMSNNNYIWLINTYDNLEIRIDNNLNLSVEYLANGKWMVYQNDR